MNFFPLGAQAAGQQSLAARQRQLQSDVSAPSRIVPDGPPETTGRRPALPRWLLLLAVFLAILMPSQGRAETSVTANVSAPSTTLDEPIRLTVTITGARNANMPAHIEAEGLDINYQSKSQRFELSSGFGATMSTVVTYLVTPQKIGKFTIPAIPLEAGGKTFNTSPISITVEKGNGSRSNPDDGETSTPKIFAELLLPKDTAYVGEIVPVEVRFYFETSVTFQLNPPGQVPQIDGEGFSKLRFPQARLEQKTIDGKDYRVLAYQTSLVAAKSGELSVGPASLNFAVGIPQKRRQRSPFDDPFNDPSGNDPFANFFGNQRIEREMTVTSDPKKLRIKSLPTPRPEGFAGAVGQFSLVVSAKPTNVKMGDPITLQSVISGRGNFDLVTSPVLSDATGWRTYPATGKLVPNDEMGVSGDKTFEMAIIPEQKHAAVPTTRFVYFDPTQEKYLTLESPAIPVTIEGQPLPSPTPVPPKLASVQPKPTPNAPPAAPDLPPVKTALVGNNGSFLPIWKTSAFWLVQSIPFLLLVGLAWPKIAAAFAPDTNETRMANLRKERQSLAAKVTSADPATFFPAAARQMEIDASLAGKSHSSPSEIIDSLGFLDAEAETAREIFIRRDELAYGGGTSRKQSGRELSPEILRRYQGVLNK